MAKFWSYFAIAVSYANLVYGQYPGIFKPNLNQNPGGDPNHQGGNMYSGGGLIMPWNTNTNQLTNPCVRLPCMLKHCDLGYKTGPNGCQWCICNQRPVTVPQYNNPCLGQPSTCDASCNGNYVTGSNGCQYCQCAGITGTAPTMTTNAPATPSPAECMMHFTNCTINCPYGFMTDSKHCDMCVCKDEVYAVASVPPERQPLVILTNPCIQGYDRCMIFCQSGYRTGPRSCQFCACRE